MITFTHANTKPGVFYFDDLSSFWTTQTRRSQ